MDDLQTNWINETQMQVQHVIEEHVWTFTFARLESGEVVVSSCDQHSADHIRATNLSMYAWRYAEREAFEAGMVDKLIRQD